jgi:hypothetical protein
MTALRKYRQLKLGFDGQQEHYVSVPVSFPLGGQIVTGILNGTAADWIFHSSSPVFLRDFPSGRLHKYELWIDRVPKQISRVYNGILASALKAGYDLAEKEEGEPYLP